MNIKRSKQRVDPVEVFCRIRPLAADSGSESCLQILDDSNLMLQVPDCSNSYKNGQIKQLIYSFTKIFEESTNQKIIFDQVGLPLVQDLLAGKNGLLFTYGVTGSGKTYTMMGNPQDLGLLQRCLDTIFNSISFQQSKKYVFKPDRLNSFEVQTESEATLERQKRDVLPPIYPTTSNVQAQIQKFRANGFGLTPNARARADAERLNEPNGKLVNINEDHIYAVFVSCTEIYNNYIYDLLDEFNTDTIKKIDTSKESKTLKEDVKGCMYIKDVTEIEVKSTEEALELMHRAQKRRVVAYTDLNSESSRSHSIFTIRIVQAPYDPSCDDYNPRSKNAINVSQLSLVDLAGCERTKRTKNTGSRLREAGSINSSLMALRNCMETLRENILNGSRRMVPYRDSKLTLLFKSFFEGNSNAKIKMILCINPSSIEFDETINVLKFSDLVRDVLVPAPTVTPASDPVHSQKHTHRSSSTSKPKTIETAFEQANSLLLGTLAQNNYSLMPTKFPCIDLAGPDDDITIRCLIEYLEELQRNRDAAVHESDLLKQQFYVHLRELQDETEKLRQERSEYKTRLDAKERDQHRADTKIKALEKAINSNTYVKSTPIHHNHHGHHHHHYSSSTGGQKENRVFGTPITNNNIPGSGSTGGGGTYNGSSDTPLVSSYRSNRMAGATTTTTTGTTTTQSIGRTPGISGGGGCVQPPQTPSAISRFNAGSGYTSRYQSPLRTPANSNQQVTATPSNRDGVPIANRRAQRRSQSMDIWLDHKPPTTTKTDTVLQPKMPKRKSVSKLELSDTKKSSKYVLTHQQQDEDGEIVTNLIKGDILKSPSGGANVIFTDVETLHVKPQEKPKPYNKRPSEDNILEDPAAVEDRCSTAIEGHSRFKSANLMKKVKI